MPLIGCFDGLVAVYASFGSTAAVVNAVNLGWKGIADVGGIGTSAAPYTVAVKPDGVHSTDQLVQSAYSQIGDKFGWLSYWTVSWPSTGDTFYNAGHLGGQVAAQTVQNTLGNFQPAYIILDPEGFNTPASNPGQWADFINGFADGVISINAAFRPAFYCGQSDYQTYNLSAINHPAFIAITPILGTNPFVSGSNITGFAAYYAACPSGAYVNQVITWHARWNSVQFNGSGVPCGPS